MALGWNMDLMREKVNFDTLKEQNNMKIGFRCCFGKACCAGHLCWVV